MKKTAIGLLLIFLSASHAFAALKANDTAPVFSLPDRGNREFSLAALVGAGRKEEINVNGIVLVFFASWCTACREELPVVNSVVDELSGKRIKVVIVGVKEDFEKIGALLNQLNVDKPIVLSDSRGKVAELYQVRFLPVTFFIGSDGKVKDVIFGEITDAAELRKSAAKLVK